MEVVERRAQVDGLDVHWREAGREPILYLHGVPTASWDWIPFLEKAGGVAPDLPGFGESAKPGDFDYSIEGYERFIEAFCEARELDRLSIVVHDWGGVGLAFAQRFPERIERLVLFTCVPLLPGYRWHRIARIWRTPGLGELLMGFSSKWAFKRLSPDVPDWFVDNVWRQFDHGTQRAILRLYRSAPEEVLARAGEGLGRVRAPALILWPTRDPYIPEKFGAAYADALGGEATLELVEAGHWSWLDRPELVERATAFLG